MFQFKYKGFNLKIFISTGFIYVDFTNMYVYIYVRIDGRVCVCQ